MLDAFSPTLRLIRLISISLFSWLPSFTYHFCQYLLRKTKIYFIVSTRCINTVVMDRFPKLAKFPGLKIGNKPLMKMKIKNWGYIWLIYGDIIGD